MKVHIVDADGWMLVYKDGVRIHDHRTPDAHTLLSKLGIEVTSESCTDSEVLRAMIERDWKPGDPKPTS